METNQTRSGSRRTSVGIRMAKNSWLFVWVKQSAVAERLCDPAVAEAFQIRQAISGHQGDLWISTPPSCPRCTNSSALLKAEHLTPSRDPSVHHYFSTNIFSSRLLHNIRIKWHHHRHYQISRIWTLYAAPFQLSSQNPSPHLTQTIFSLRSSQTLSSSSPYINITDIVRAPATEHHTTIFNLRPTDKFLTFLFAPSHLRQKHLLLPHTLYKAAFPF